MEHEHVYDKDGKQICCTQEEKINKIADVAIEKEHQEAGESAIDDHDNLEDEHSDDDGHNHSSGEQTIFQMFSPPIVSFVLSEPICLFAQLPVFRWLLF